MRHKDEVMSSCHRRDHEVNRADGNFPLQKRSSELPTSFGTSMVVVQNCYNRQKFLFDLLQQRPRYYRRDHGVELFSTTDED